MQLLDEGQHAVQMVTERRVFHAEPRFPCAVPYMIENFSPAHKVRYTPNIFAAASIFGQQTQVDKK